MYFFPHTNIHIIYEFFGTTSSRFVPLRSHICVFLSLALARTMQKNDRARDDGHKDSVSAHHTPLFYSTLPYTSCDSLLCTLMVTIIKKIERKKRKNPNLHNGYSISNTLFSQFFHPSPTSPIKKTVWAYVSSEVCTSCL